MVQARWNGLIVADSNETVLIERSTFSAVRHQLGFA